MSLLTYSSLIKLMKQSTRFRKQSSGKSKDLKQIYKENIADKKLNIKDTPKNRIKLQTIIKKIKLLSLIKLIQNLIQLKRTSLRMENLPMLMNQTKLAKKH